MKTTSVILLAAALSLSPQAFAQNKKVIKKPKAQAGAPAKPDVAPAETAPPVTAAEPVAPEPVPAPAAPVVEQPAPIETKPEAAASSSSGGQFFGLHAAVGVPHPARVGIDYVMASRMFSFEANVGSYSLTVSDVKAKMTNAEIGLRWHPFLGSFYVGALLGNRTLTAEKTEFVSGANVNVTAKAEVKSNYVAPHVGWMWGMDNGGFFLSMDFGALSPSGVTTTFTSDAPTAATTQPDYIKLESDVRDEGKKLGEATLPVWTLLKIGWLF